MNLFLKPFLLVFSGIMLIAGCSKDDDETTTPSINNCTNTTSVFAIQLNGNDCNVDIESTLGVTSIYDENVSGTTRTVNVNNIANHNVGVFPNSGNPNNISPIMETFSMTTEPSKASSPTYGEGWSTGVLFSGVIIEPYTAEFFTGSSGPNRNWNITALQSTRDLGLDCNNAHVQPTGRYHYHGTPSAYINDLSANTSTKMTKVGYAADGYPIYYKYAYADDGLTIEAFVSGWKLKTTDRGGDGVSAPDGCPDGYYFQDYEYVEGTGLDECNGRTGKTPESDSEYFYVITDDFPSMPLCFMGTPDQSFRH